jgi:signal transduction histidine kinase
VGSTDLDARERLAAVGEIAAEVAHELRNVLQVISASAYVARLEASRGDAAAALPYVAKVEKSARTAHGIVDDLMALARGETLASEPVPLADVVAAARGELADGAAHWEDVIEPAALRVRGHAGLLVRLMHILYDNAILASAPRPPRIVTRGGTVGERVIVEVTDDGPGLPPELVPRLFEPLVTARPGGTGLGLALARRIVGTHGGTIALSTPPQPTGASFRIELPAPA